MEIRLILCMASISYAFGYSNTPIQYHIQTDKGPNRYFRFQTYNGQYRKEKRFDDGTVVGTYGWVDPNGLLRLYDYIADTKGYRVVRTRIRKTEKPSNTPHITNRTPVRKGSISSQVPKRRRPIRRRKPQPNRNQIPSRQPTRKRGKPIVKDSVTSASEVPQTPRGFEMTSPGGKVIIDYDLGNQYRKEKLYSDGRTVGEHGYVDPLGILRKTYYTSGPGGHKEEKISYWVGSRDPRS